MPKNDENGGGKNGEKKDSGRDKKGRFKPGYSGGPGRSNKQLKPLGSDEFKNIIAQGLRSKDGKERAVWAKVKLAYDKQEGSKDDVTHEPWVDELITLLSHLSQSYSGKTGVPTSGLEIIKLMLRACPNCDEFGGGKGWGIEEIKDGDL
jgi:hypothetical protein